MLGVVCPWDTARFDMRSWIARRGCGCVDAPDKRSPYVTKPGPTTMLVSAGGAGLFAPPTSGSTQKPPVIVHGAGA